MNFDYTYRDYRVKIRYTNALAALIWPPTSGLAISAIPQATRAEGEAVLRERVQEAIDADVIATEEAIRRRESKA